MSFRNTWRCWWCQWLRLSWAREFWKRWHVFFATAKMQTYDIHNCGQNKLLKAFLITAGCRVFQNGKFSLSLRLYLIFALCFKAFRHYRRRLMYVIPVIRIMSTILETNFMQLNYDLSQIFLILGSENCLYIKHHCRIHTLAYKFIHTNISTYHFWWSNRYDFNQNGLPNGHYIVSNFYSGVDGHEAYHYDVNNSISTDWRSVPLVCPLSS